MEKKWVNKGNYPIDEVREFSNLLNINAALASILLQRGIDSFDKAKNFFRPSLNDLHDPFLMMDMEKAVNRLCEAIFQKEKILIYGDYDVDGTTSVAMTFDFLLQFTDPDLLDYYIPDRYTEGYGLSGKGVEYAADKGVKLIITLDCGIRAIQNTSYANEKGIDLIICDHHNPGDKLPEAFAVLDPKRADCSYPFKELSGCGVGFKLLQGFCLQNTVDLQTLYNYLDLVAISIGCDMVAMTGENRTMAFYGLRKINSNPMPGIQSLIKVSGLKSKIKISDLVFYVGPRINAAGRLAHANQSVQLLINKDEAELNSFSKQINEINADRKVFDESTTASALEMIKEESPDKKTTVLFNESWHKGIVGIVASRCIEHYYRPTIILTAANGMATGSARSVAGYNVYDAIDQCSSLLHQYGGHNYAAGLSLELSQLSAFKKKFDEVVSSSISQEQLKPTLNIDLEVSLDFINFKSLGIIQQMAPFGPGNLDPLFVTKGVYLQSNPKLIKEKHLKLTLNQESTTNIEAIAFGMVEYLDDLVMGKPFDIAYHIEENEYRGNKTLQVIIKDIKIA